jgi:beta-glucosidase
VTFLWGTATAAHQVEGENVHSDWWDAEERGLLPHRSGRACDFWRRWKSDFDLIASWGHTAFRFSVEWARVEPRPGHVDEDALGRYVEMARSLRTLGIEPVVTLHHFVNPLWFAEAGGFEKEANVGAFLGFCERVGRALRPHVRYWVTVNEPVVYAYQSYSRGYWPPFRKHLGLAFRVTENLLRAHAGAYATLHDLRPDAMVSLANHLRVTQPFRPWHPGDRLAARVQDYVGNEAVLRSLVTGRLFGRRVPGLAGSWDYVGLNYYTRIRLRATVDPSAAFGAEVPPEPAAETTTMGWEVYPEGLYLALRRLGRYRKPVIVTENGIATDDDAQRVRYLHSHLAALDRARREGSVEIMGYLYWTLMDNFEWAEGFEPRFGLVETDFETLERRPRPSAMEFARLRGEFTSGGRTI